MEGSLTIPRTTNSVPDHVNRRSGNYHPSIWGDRFLSEKSAEGEITNKILKLKEEVKKMVAAPVEDPSKKLNLVDAIQRLGVSYHFEKEIETVLHQIYDNTLYNCPQNAETYDDDLHTVALCFRLLRQQGYPVSCDIFKNFKKTEGKFKETLASDIRGMLSLYEATYLRVHGEDILDEALVFTTTCLKSAASSRHLSPSFLVEQVTHALKQPIRKGLTRLEARHYMSVYQQDPSHNKVLLNFAKLDFNLLQKVHQEELSHIARWWKELDFARKLPFARDRVIECYFWILGVYFEPEYGFARRALTKVIAMTSVIDDIYDVYGTLEELELFSEAAERWDVSAMDKLPEYMKVCYKALLNVYDEIEENLATEDGKLYRLDYAKEAMKRQIRAYVQEAKWFNLNYTPTMEEYMPLARVTSAYAMLATTSFVGMGDIVTKDSFEWLFSNPKLVSASEVVCRLMDDIVSHMFEQKRGHVASAVECYMKQHDATEEEAVKDLRKQVINAWKDINEECLYPISVPMPLLMRVVNLARVIDVINKDEDGYTHSKVVLKDFIASMLIDPVPE
ncbi:(-)-germacrene D synthase [Morus notabilis]|uniref:(-)-germacrene D synthase n=1 Tax=Morus notabilis TaxID=981085 RepID=W9RCH9_9ROSA|nr:(-)-germacrene D synthase [Morus notabilis]EXB50920.1 (-)-germacrene D synthase [Morus notabilis]